MRKITAGQRKGVFALWSYCAYCKQPFSGPNRRRTVDHLLPQYRGGTNDPSNLVGCCNACNVAKGCRTPEEWLTELADAIREIRAGQGDAVEAGGPLS